MTNKTVYSWLSPKLEVRDAGKCGKGIFSNVPIKKDERLAVFGGYVISIKDEERLSKECEDSGVQITEELVITSKDAVEDTDFFNHSCNPNAGFHGQIFLVAMRDIKKDEEVTFDYAMVLCRSDSAKPYNMKCLCGASNCRGFITDDDWRNTAIQNEYDGYFQTFISEKIKGDKKHLLNKK